MESGMIIFFDTEFTGLTLERLLNVSIGLRRHHALDDDEANRLGLNAAGDFVGTMSDRVD